MNGKRVVIVGGGTAGLLAAYTLEKKGVHPIVLEANDRAGGRLGGDRVGDFYLDEGADWFTPSHAVAISLCEELGLPLIIAAQTAAWCRRGRFLVTRHADVKPLTLLGNVPALARLGLLTPRSILTLLKISRQNSAWDRHASFASDTLVAEADNDELFVDYMKRLGAPEDLVVVIRCFMEGGTMGDFYRMSTIQVMTFLHQILTKGHLSRVPVKGIGSVAHSLVDRIGDCLRLSTPARQVNIADGMATDVVVDGETIEADVVICATTATMALKIIPALPEPLRQALSKIVYSVGVRVVMGLEHRPLPPEWTAVLYPEDETPLLLDRSSYLSACVPPGTATLDLLVGRDRARELLPLSDAEIKHELLADAHAKAPPGSNLPGDDDGIFTRVYRWHEAVPTPPPGTFRAIAEARRSHGRAIPNLFLAGEYMGNPSVNAALTSGRDTANAVRDDFRSLEQ